MAKRNDILTVESSPGPKYHVTYPDHRITSSFDLQKSRPKIASSPFVTDHGLQAAEQIDKLKTPTLFRKKNYTPTLSINAQNKQKVVENSITPPSPKVENRPQTEQIQRVPKCPFDSQARRKPLYDVRHSYDPKIPLNIERGLNYIKPHVDSFIYKPLHTTSPFSKYYSI